LTSDTNSNEAPYEQEDNHFEHCSYGTPVYIEPDQVLVPLLLHFDHFTGAYVYLSIVIHILFAVGLVAGRALQILMIKLVFQVSGKHFFLYYLIINFLFSFSSQLPTYVRVSSSIIFLNLSERAVSHFPLPQLCIGSCCNTIMTSSHTVECLPGTMLLCLWSATYLLFICPQEQARLHR